MMRACKKAGTICLVGVGMAGIVAVPSRAAAPPATLHQSDDLLEVRFHLRCAFGARTFDQRGGNNDPAEMSFEGRASRRAD